VTLQHEYKKIRRTLRAASFVDQGNLLIEREVFEQLMDRLEDCQLRAESLYRQVLVEKELFGFKKPGKKSNGSSSAPRSVYTGDAKVAREADTEEGNPSQLGEGGQDDYADDKPMAEGIDKEDQVAEDKLTVYFASDDLAEDDLAEMEHGSGKIGGEDSGRENILSNSDDSRIVNNPGDNYLIRDDNKSSKNKSENEKTRENINLGAELRNVQDCLRQILRQYENEYILRRQVDPRSLIVIRSPLREFIVRNKRTKHGKGVKPNPAVTQIIFGSRLIE
jgi:hypothetical protein